MNKVVRENLMSIKGYHPYCGGMKNCGMARSVFNGNQFYCQSCGWVSEFPDDFIKEYKNKWGLDV